MNTCGIPNLSFYSFLQFPLDASLIYIELHYQENATNFWIRVFLYENDVSIDYEYHWWNENNSADSDCII
jgi:hypothetical protein